MISQEEAEVKLIHYLENKKTTTGGHCGVKYSVLQNDFNIDLSDLKQILNRLYKNRIITIHDGAHGILIKKI